MIQLLNLGCPSVTLPTSDIVTCRSRDTCSDIECCFALDIKVAQLFVDTRLTVDPCDLSVTLSLGKWSEFRALSDDIWGIDITTDVGNALQIV